MIRVYGKPGCGLCDAAKKKLRLLGIPFEEHTVAYHTQHHEGWRQDGSADVAAAYSDLDTMPLIEIDGEIYTYSQAMKILKRKR